MTATARFQRPLGPPEPNRGYAAALTNAPHTDGKPLTLEPNDPPVDPG